jgi:hypothetical protein
MITNGLIVEKTSAFTETDRHAREPIFQGA